VTRRRAEPLKHFVWFDEPSATNPRRQKAVCGALVDPRAEVVHQREAITCEECKQIVCAYDTLEV